MMSAGQWVALGLSLGIGLLLGLIGSGGSILILPALVYIAGIEPHAAVPMSMAVVGSTSLVGAWWHARRGDIHYRAVLLFGGTGIVGAYLGSAGTHWVGERTLMLLFAGLLLVVGVLMLRGWMPRSPAGVCQPFRCLLLGAAVGLLSGLFGVGGGFLIVPALVLFAGVRTRAAIGTSLAIIALNAGAGLAGQLRYGGLVWGYTLALVGVTLGGMFLGLAVSGRRLAEEHLRKGFAFVLLLVAVGVAGLNLFAR